MYRGLKHVTPFIAQFIKSTIKKIENILLFEDSGMLTFVWA